ncbi:TPA: fimbrial protein [Escherichia coli]|nr:fimbrial protein [Escherichia coli]
MRIILMKPKYVFNLLIAISVSVFSSAAISIENFNCRINHGGLDIPMSVNDPYSRDNIPFKLSPVSRTNVFVTKCDGTDTYDMQAKVNLPIKTKLNGQTVFDIGSEDIGIIIAAGDTYYKKMQILNDNQWHTLYTFHTYQSLGGTVQVWPVILRTIPSGVHQINVPNYITFKQSARTQQLHGTTENPIDLKFTVTVTQRTCSLRSPSSIILNMPTIGVNAITGRGKEQFGGQTRLSLNCESGVTAWATLTDATTPGNRTDILTLSSNSTASGVGIKLYKDDSATALKFGPDSAIKGNINQWQFSKNNTERNPSVVLKAYYVNTSGNISPGTVNAISTITFSYQ